MKAFLLAAGKGERLQPLTYDVPKALINVKGKPLIQWNIERLKRCGIRDIIINLHHLGQKIEDFLEDGSKFGVNIQYSKEFLEANYLPVEKVLTRAENGEHEYRYSEWNQFFKDSKFSVIQSLIIVENNKLHKVKNDAGLDEILVDYELGGFERQKVIYLLKSMK